MPNMLKRKISIALLDVRFDARNTRLSEEAALIQVFAHTERVSLKSGSRATYESGNYRKVSGPKPIWVGRLDLARAAERLTKTYEEGTGWKLSSEGRPVATSDSSTFYAYDPAAHLLAYRERSWLPFSRMVSYVRKAAAAPDRHYSLSLEPRAEERSLREWLAYFDSVQAINIEYRHSQSPGNRSVDMIFDDTGAERAHERLAAAKGGSLNAEALTNGRSHPAQLIDHIDRNKDNGEVQIDGKVGDESIKISTSEGVTRRVRETGSDERSIVSTLVDLLRNFGQGD